MVTINLNLSSSNFYKFTDPVRKYKANDPYYYEVDNIPIKQLEENILWLREAFENTTVDVELEQPQQQVQGGSRSTFTELQPFVSGVNSNIVSVKPGNFIARINDAYNLTPLQVIGRSAGLSFGEFNEWDVGTIDNALMLPTLNRFKSYINSEALGLNGLAERSFGSFALFNLNSIGVATSGSINPNLSFFNIAGINPDFTYPTFLWTGSPRNAQQGSEGVSGPYLKINQFNSTNPDGSPGKGFASLYELDTQFIKKWRGVARTAVVDVPENLSINIEPFNSDDFSYIDEDGLVVDSSDFGSPAASATHRLDLLFIYSKPIDTSAAHLTTSWNSFTPRKIYKAELGIVKGAGLVLNYQTGRTANSKFFYPTYQDSILANVADQNNTDLGFDSIDVRGSFPSPDDLMNISPVLAEWLPNNHYALVGQSILPIAYIVVKNNKLNESLNQIIESEDIIDIRPFFRTTELTYGERAGIAAALPNISLANPVATEGYVKYESNRAYNLINSKASELDARINQLNAANSTIDSGMGRVLTRGIVRGGNYYGPEGAICAAIKEKYDNPIAPSNKEEVIAKFKELHNLPPSYEFVNLPDWDLANWVFASVTGTGNSYPSIGYGVIDRINIAINNRYVFGNSLFTGAQYEFSNTELPNSVLNANRSLLTNSDTFGRYTTAPINNSKRSPPRFITNLNWLTKTITLDITDTPWVEDITVIPKFWNCFTYKNTEFQPESSIFVSKGPKRGPIIFTEGSTQTTKYFIDFTIIVILSQPLPVPPVSGSTLPYGQIAVGTGAATGTYIYTNPRAEMLTGVENFAAFSHALQWTPSGSPIYPIGGGPIPVIYPSVEYTVIGHPYNYGNGASQFFNGIHKVPGMLDHENYPSTGRTDRPRIVTRNRPPEE